MTEDRRFIPAPNNRPATLHSPNALSLTVYPPRALPGTRDFDTPYGNTRVYEWGPTYGRKVLFIHGDATPSPAFSKIAHGLVDKGCRVILFDLWGRGYSAAPLGARYDSRLFSTQTLYALSSSPLNWLGEGFSIIAFSLGAPIAFETITTFPGSIEAVVLLGPAGLIRDLPPEYTQIKDPLTPLDRSDRRMRTLVEAALGVDPSLPMRSALKNSIAVSASDVSDGASTPNKSAPMHFEMSELVQWQYEFNEGAVHAFYETVRQGTAVHQQSLWSRFGGILRGNSEKSNGLAKANVLIIFGDDDDVVIPSETSEDILKLLPKDKVVFKSVPGGHGFVYPNSDKILDLVTSHWHIEKG